MIRQNWYKILIIISLISIVLNSGFALYLLFFDDPETVTVLSSSIINKDPIRSGDALLVKRSFCLWRPPIKNSAQRSVENSLVYALANHEISVMTIGCTFDNIDKIEIPELLPGTYVYKYGFRVQINWLRAKVVHMPDLVFNVDLPIRGLKFP